MLLPASDKDGAAGDPGAATQLEREYAEMEQWLDGHPDFIQEYFARKATRTMIDGWLLAHSLSLTMERSCSPPVVLDASSSTGSNSRASSGANTPVRKISAQEFEKRGQILRPMVLTIEGVPSFLGTQAASSESTVSQSKAPRRRRSELKALDECELMYELVMDICNELDMTTLCHKILQNVSLLLGADRCSLFLVQGNGATRCLVTQLFDVSVRTTLQDCTRSSEEIRVPWGTGIVGYVAMTGDPVNIPDAYEVSVRRTTSRDRSCVNKHVRLF